MAASLHDLLVQVKAEQARRRLAEFTRQAWHAVEPSIPLLWNWHVDAICEHLEAVTQGEIRNLLINVPPRFMKSTLVSVMWPMWVWTFCPDFKWMYTSYALSLAIRDSLKCRRLIESPWYQRSFGDVFQLANDQNLKSRYENTKSGYRLAFSVNASVIGEGADGIVVDDPHNVREAESDTVREGVLDWWDQAISTRLNDPKRGIKVIIMQRLHEQDLAGHVLEQGGYEHLNLPMEFEPERKSVTCIGWEDPRTTEGELLWTARVGPPEVARMKEVLGPYAYAAQAQQQPVPKGGTIFQQSWMLKRYQELPTLTYTIQSVDSAFKEGVAHDWSVIATWGTDGVNYYLLNIWRERVTFPALIQAIKDQYAAWHPNAVLIEDAASGQSAIQVLREDTNMPILAVPAQGSKVSRAEGVSPLFAAGKVWLPEEAVWLAAWILEHVKFPRMAKDDQVDTSSMGLEWLRTHSGTAALSYAEEMKALMHERLKVHQAQQAQGMLRPY